VQTFAYFSLSVIGIVVPRINRFFFSSVIGGIEQQATRKGYQTIICQTHELFANEKECLQALCRTRVAGIIMSLSAETTTYTHLRKLLEKQLPLVMFDRVYEPLSVPSVMIDDYRGAYQATAHLIENGCKRIVHLGGPQHLNNIYRNRYKGYCDALTAAGYEISSSLVFFDTLTKERGKEAMKEVLKKKSGRYICSK